MSTEAQTISGTAVCRAIANGELDDDLAVITTYMVQRRKVIAQLRTWSIKPGDTVEFSDLIRPRYLIGLTAIVTQMNRTTITVSCPDDPSYGRFQGAKNVRCPKNLIAGVA